MVTKVKVKTILKSGLYHLLKEQDMRNHVSDLLQKQLQTAFVKSGLTTKQFYDYILIHRDNVFDYREDNGYYSFHATIKAHDNDELESVVSFSIAEGGEWGCKF